MPLDAAKARDILSRRLTQAQAAVGDGVVAEIKETIGTQYPPASTPGQPPHRRTGGLQDGVTSTTENQGTRIVTAISSDRVGGGSDVPSYLEFGTSKMAPRPYMQPSMRRSKSKVLSQIAAEARI